MISKIKSLILTKVITDGLLKKFISGAFWSVIGNVVVKGLSLVAGLFVARFLGSISFGELSIIKSTISVFGLLASFGLGFTITKLVGESLSKSIDEVGEIISATNVIILFSGLFFGVILFLIAPLVAVYIFENKNIVLPLRIAGVFLFFNAVNIYQLGVVSGLQLFKGLARINVILGIISFPIILSFTYFFGLIGTVIGMTLNMGVGCILSYLLISKGLKNSGIRLIYKKLKHRIKKILMFSLPLALKEIIYSSGNWIAYYILLHNSDFKQVGVYNSANQLSQIILFLPIAVLGVSLSMLSNNIHDSKNYVYLLKKSLLFNFIIVIAIGSLMAIFSGFIYDFYGETYTGGQEVLYILIITTIPMSFISVFEQVCISYSKPTLVTIFAFLKYVVIISCIFLFFRKHQNAASLAYAFLVGQTVIMFSMFMYLKIKGFFRVNSNNPVKT